MAASALLLAASIAAAGAAEVTPKRVASLNLCTDELLLLIAAPEQIASVTHLAQQQAELPYWRAARRYRPNDGSLLSVTHFRPGLVLTVGGGARDRQRIAERLGIRVIDLPYPRSLGDVEASIRTVSSALGQPAKGAQLLRQMAALQASAPRSARDTIWLGGGGRTLGADSLGAQWLRLAGMRQRRVVGDRVGLEQLLVSPPSVLLRSDYRTGEYSGEQRWLSHPLARRARGGITLTTDGRRWTCMGPSLIPEILRLRRALGR